MKEIFAVGESHGCLEFALTLDGASIYCRIFEFNLWVEKSACNSFWARSASINALPQFNNDIDLLFCEKVHQIYWGLYAQLPSLFSNSY